MEVSVADVARQLPTPFARKQDHVPKHPAWRRIGRIISAGLLCGSLLPLLNAAGPVAEAANVTSAPFASRSWYVYHTELSTTNDSTYDTSNPMYRLGHQDGARIGSRCGDFMTILDFGQPERAGSVGPYSGYGFNLKDSYKGSDGNMHPYFFRFEYARAAVFQYAWGWYNATGTCPTLKLLLGVSNYHPCEREKSCKMSSYGNVLGSVIADTVSAVNQYGLQSQVWVWAGLDAEPAYSTPTQARNLVDAFGNNDPNSSRLYDFGTAESGYWDGADYDIYYVAYGAWHDYALPEILNSGTVSDWIRVRRHQTMSFEGVETDCPQSNHYSPSPSWNALWNALNQNGYAQSTMPYATNLGSGAQSQCES
jgi:hypothetical protein